MQKVNHLPKNFRKVIVKELSNDFDKATEIVSVEFDQLLKALRPHQVILRYHYAGINASDINFTAGRYDPTLRPPFDCGFEGLGEVVVKGSKTSVPLMQPVAVM
jgi:NADPH:quinone reductase-like Zn-dependent oxidoreductase